MALYLVLVVVQFNLVMLALDPKQMELSIGVDVPLEGPGVPRR